MNSWRLNVELNITFTRISCLAAKLSFSDNLALDILILLGLKFSIADKRLGVVT